MDIETIFWNEIYLIRYLRGDAMKETIWEYLIPSIPEKEELWESCFFVFDTNVLLNLYRYTSNTRDTLINAFEDLKERIWLPHQVAYEYAKNRFEVIFEMVQKYEDLEKMKQELVSNYTRELRLDETDQSIQELQSAMDAWIAEQKSKNLIVTRVSEDKILDKIISIFDGKVGKPFTEEETKEIFEEGQERYKKHIPPGFCDAGKSKDGEDNNIYGDLLVWKQILLFSKDNKKDIIYVTHDQKNDWWEKAKGRTIGPRVELRKEFAKETGQNFYMYSMESFLEQYSRHKGQQADQRVIEEVLYIEKKYKENQHNQNNNTDVEILSIERKINRLQEKIGRQQRAIIDLRKKYNNRTMPLNKTTQLKNTEQKMMQRQQELARYQAELALYKQKYNDRN